MNFEEDFFSADMPLAQEMPTFEELMNECQPPPQNVPQNLLDIINSQGQLIAALNEIIHELREQTRDNKTRLSRIESNVEIMTGRVEKRRETSRKNRLKKKSLVQDKLLFQ